jgi:hypothetical protein
MELIGEEEIQEVLGGGYLFRYCVSVGTDADPRFKGNVYPCEREIASHAGVRCGQIGLATHIDRIERPEETMHAVLAALRRTQRALV